MSYPNPDYDPGPMDKHPEAILQRFCAETAECRPELAQPWTRDGYAYATDGHVLVRCPAQFAPEVAPNPDAPDADKLKVDWTVLDDCRATDRFRHAIQLRPAPERHNGCCWCEGFGALLPCPRCEREGKHEACPDCGGSGAVGGEGPDASLCGECEGRGIADNTPSDTCTVDGATVTGDAVRHVLAALPGVWWRRDGEYVHFALGIYRGVCMRCEE